MKDSVELLCIFGDQEAKEMAFGFMVINLSAQHLEAFLGGI